MTSSDLRCPQCSAHIRPDADWCTLCYADLRVPPVPPEPRESPAIETVPDGEPAGELTADPKPAAELDEDGRGKHARSATAYDDAVAREAVSPRDEAASAELEARADQMLAILAAESSRPLGPWADHLESSTSRVVVGLIGLVVLAVAGLIVMTVVGQFV
jgi:hypothetical protein